MNKDIQVLFVSGFSADERVLSALLALDQEAGDRVRVTSVSDAEAFFDALYAELSYRVVVIDDRQSWADWKTLVAACAKSSPSALLVLLVAEDRLADTAQLLLDDVAAVYPRNSSGLISLARLVSRLAEQEHSFSLGRQGLGHADTGGEQEREGLVYAVSHDLQDPLQLARRYADILHEDYEDELGQTGSKILGNLQFNLRRTQEMLDELLDYSRLQNAHLEKEPVDFDELLAEVVGMYKLTLEEIGGKVTRQQSMPSLVVDRRQMRRVFQNLIGNAIKFRSERPLQIVVRAQRVRDEWRIGFKDNGIGLAEEDTRRIFDMFERAGPVDEYPGTGMGLAICKRIIQNHGGRIWVRSSLGSGSVFIFSLPQADETGRAEAGDLQKVMPENR